MPRNIAGGLTEEISEEAFKEEGPPKYALYINAGTTINIKNKNTQPATIKIIRSLFEDDFLFFKIFCIIRSSFQFMRLMVVF